MSKRNRLLDKLIESAGGWELFLYQTLKDVCDEVSDGEILSIRQNTAIEEAREVLDAYDHRKIKVTRELDRDLSLLTEEKSNPVRQKLDTSKVNEIQPGVESVQSDKEAGIKEIVYFEPAPRQEPKPRPQTVVVAVDKHAGASQGELSLPSNHKVVNRQHLVVTSQEGIEFGRGSEDGQVRGPGVSGHVSTEGVYRLVFSEVNIGVGLIKFEVVALPSKMTKEQFEKSVAVRNGITTKELQEGMQKLEKIIVPCDCGVEACFGWKYEDKAEIERIASLQAERMLRMGMTGPPSKEKS